ncbi:MAG: hypothetical protein ACRD3N_00860 [Terracidiphilus sp.]
MKMRISVAAAISGAALFFSAMGAAGQTTKITFGNWSAESGPYPATVGGQNTLVVCDDYADHVETGETWDVTTLQASKLTTSNITQTYFGGLGVNDYHETAQEMVNVYTAIAYLSEALLTAPGQPLTDNSTATVLTNVDSGNWTAAQVNEAIWDLTSPFQGGSSTTFSGGPSDLASYVESLVGSSINLSSFSDLYFHTAVVGSESDKGLGQPQEMVSVPEGGAAPMYLLIACAVCFGAIRFGAERKTA